MLEKVIGIVDGRTFETAGRDFPVRLADVDTPHRGRPGYGRAKIKLGRLIHGRDVAIKKVGEDPYGRTVAKVKLGDISINLEMQTLD